MARATLLLLILLYGCTSVEEFALRNVPDGPSTSWRYGYADGCWSQRNDSGQHKERRRDVARFRSDDQYRDGWETGYKDCLARAQSEPSPTPTPATVATETPESTPPATPTLEPTPRPEPTSASSSSSAAAEAATRRTQIENRIRELRGELKSLEAELKDLPK